MNDKIIGFGLDKNSRIGVGNEDDAILTPSLLRIFNEIKIEGISAGKNHTLAWDSKGHLFSWGDALDGKLGHPIEANSITFNKIEKQPKLIKSLLGTFIIQAAAANNYSIALS